MRLEWAGAKVPTGGARQGGRKPAMLIIREYRATTGDSELRAQLAAGKLRRERIALPGAVRPESVAAYGDRR